MTTASAGGKRPSPPSAPRVVGETEDFAVISKPAHLLVHPTKPTREATLSGWLQQERPGELGALAQRLDRETSGLLLAAKTAAAASELGRLIEKRQVEKEYMVIVQGRVEPAEGVIDAPLGRIGLNADNPIYLKRGVIPGGAPARTEFITLGRGERFSLLRVKTQTGRLHQSGFISPMQATPWWAIKLTAPIPRFISNSSNRAGRPSTWKNSAWNAMRCTHRVSGLSGTRRFSLTIRCPVT